MELTYNPVKPVNLTDIASKAVNSCSVMTNRTKIKQAELVGKPININGVGFIDSKGQKVPVLTCVEYPDKYFFGGRAFVDITDAWLAAVEGDLDVLNDMLQETPVEVELRTVNTKSGNTYTQVTVN